MKKKIENIFLKKKILIYGLGKSGISSFRFLRNKADIYLFDDLKNTHPKQISKLKLLKIKFDIIIISPGINIVNCKLSKFLKLNKKKIFTDLDVFFTFFKNKCITITGTNGKSTTAKILYEVLKDQKKDVRLIGNIGNPPLNEKKISKNTIFVIEASSYQLDYSQLFSSKYSIILNIKPDHLERHKTLQNYVNAKFKLLDSQSKSCLAFVKSDDVLISKKLKNKKFNCKIVKVNTKKNYNDFLEIKNKYFLTESNRENLSFIIELAKKLKLKNNLLQKTIKNFKGLKYRQQIILQKKNLTIINDSKSTSFSSSVGMFKKSSNILWLLGGIYKKGDKLQLKKKDLSNVTAFIYGENKNLFIKQLRGKVKFKNYINLEDAVKNVFSIIKTKRSIRYTILFSPCAASFDSFKNFEERGLYFNRLVKRFMYGK
ncbi:UDP-N-acetylmuramoyl-L-alanine--D-glutamate ligase [Candidatus Pelagibacter sp.]|uniref:UDP-N-acetylmuramoyl-L-alanine--D-glutamate ligase n=1 Tax=Candidatus Pelagibacter sp. TaxID=2024849 RepID=UPI003F8418A8